MMKSPESVDISAASHRSNLRSRKRVAIKKFAGRIGGNQDFINDSGDDGPGQPDEAPLSSLHSALALDGFTSPELWRLACLEGLGSFLLSLVLGAVSSGLPSSGFSIPVQSIIAAVMGWFALAMFTYCLGPISGAHLTPVITMATFFTGLSTLPRAVLYISAQVIGAMTAAYWLKLGTGSSFFEKGVIGGCTVVEGMVTPGQLFVLEFGFCLVMIFLAFGTGLDPRQGRTIGPTYAPILIGLSLALGSAASSFAKPGYTGMSFNPARCLAFMTATNNLQYHYIHWLAPLAATMLNGLVYRIVPPWSDNQPLLSRLHVVRQSKGRV